MHMSLCPRPPLARQVIGDVYMVSTKSSSVPSPIAPWPDADQSGHMKLALDAVLTGGVSSGVARVPTPAPMTWLHVRDVWRWAKAAKGSTRKALAILLHAMLGGENIPDPGPQGRGFDNTLCAYIESLTRDPEYLELF